MTQIAEYIEAMPKGFKLIQQDGEFKLGLDAILLSNYLPLSKDDYIADLGCGGGAIPVLLAARRDDIFIDGIEIMPAACDLARRNVDINRLERRVKIIEGDIRFIRRYMRAGEYSGVVSNPPYIKYFSGRRPMLPRFALARTEEACTVDDICFAARRLLHYGGDFAIVYRPERLVDMVYTMRSYGLEPKKMRFIYDRPGKEPSLVLILAKRGARPGGLEVEPPFYLFDGEGGLTVEMKEIYAGNAGKDILFEMSKDSVEEGVEDDKNE